MPLTASSQNSRKPSAPRWRNGFRPEPNAEVEYALEPAQASQRVKADGAQRVHSASMLRVSQRGSDRPGDTTHLPPGAPFEKEEAGHGHRERHATGDLEDQAIVVAVFAGLRGRTPCTGCARARPDRVNDSA